MTDTFFIDRLAIGAIAIANDHINMYCSYIDPVTAVEKADNFDVRFDTLYPYINRKHVGHSDYLLDILSSLATDDISEWIDIDEKRRVHLSGLILRLECVYEGKYEQRKNAGFLITDIAELPPHICTFVDHVKPPRSRPAAHRKKVKPAFEAVSTHLAALALRFYFYQDAMGKGKTQKEAFELSGLDHEQDLKAAEAAAYHVDVLLHRVK